MTDDALPQWAEQLARSYLATLPRRLAHVVGVARHAAQAAAVVDDPNLLLAAAWLHDIGYAEDLCVNDFHPVDGALYLRQVGAGERLCGLVANHSAAQVEARRRAIEIEWADERTPLRDALWWADMTTTPTGGTTSVEERVAEVQARYGTGHVVADAVAEAAPYLVEAAARTEQRIAEAAAQVK
ncbi:HD domain-containing protein [Nocardia xishanensis]|uniref:HD domain-containing protein n=1 Tax=Nocardia xishanensis TaxID=238964 RepID=UPI00082AA92A|nr:HD domain-containing protein [Nocardia xishanensis]